MKTFANSRLAIKNLKYPIVLGPFGGGSSNILLTSAISNCGGLGSFGAHHLSPLEITSVIKSLYDSINPGLPFSINLWVPMNEARNIKLWREHCFPSDCLQKSYAKFNMKIPQYPADDSFQYNFDEQIDAVLEAKPPVISFVMGVPQRSILERAKNLGIYTIAAATTVEEGKLLEAAGLDAIVAAGFEGGGHKPSFLKDPLDSLTGTFSLVPSLRDNVSIPVIAAGGISDSRGVVAAFALGADAVQIGSAFLVSKEANVAQVHKDMILTQSVETVLTRSWSGRHARGLKNEFVQMMGEDVPGYPVQNYLTGPLRKAAKAAGNKEYLSLWCGQSASLARQGFAEDIFQGLLDGVKEKER